MNFSLSTHKNKYLIVKPSKPLEICGMTKCFSTLYAPYSSIISHFKPNSVGFITQSVKKVKHLCHAKNK